MQRITGSKAHLVWQCPASPTLDWVVDPPGPPAERGTAIHAFLDRVKKEGMTVEKAIDAAPEEYRDFMRLLDVDALPTHLSTEVSFCWDWRARTGRELGTGLERRYWDLKQPPGPTEDPVTIDVLGGSTLEDGRRRIYVSDYKSGWTRYPTPDRFAQTLIAACAAADVFKADDAHLELIYLDNNGDDRRSTALVTAWDLDAWADEWAMARQLAEDYWAGERARVFKTGEHCRYCPGFKACPAQTGFVGRMVQVTEQLSKSAYLAPEYLASAYKICEQLRSSLNAVESEIFAHVAVSGVDVDLGEGRFLGERVTKRETLVGHIAAALVEERYGVAARREAAIEQVSKERLSDVVGARRAKGEKLTSKRGDGVLDRLYAELRSRNGITVKESRKVGVIERKARQLPEGER